MKPMTASTAPIAAAICPLLWKPERLSGGLYVSAVIYRPSRLLAASP